MTLCLSGLTKRYAGFTLGPVDLTVGREVVALLGPSGCGKTTLLSLVAGTATADEGAIRLGDARLDALPLDTRGVAYVFQQRTVFPHLTVRQNIAYAGAGARPVEEAAALLDLSPLLARAAGALSGGEARRVELARALAARPRVMLLDEPTTGLDTPVKQRLLGPLRDLLSQMDVPVLYVTHDQEEAAAVADRVAVMRAGAVEQVARPARLYYHPASPFAARFTGNPNVFRGRFVDRPEPHVEWNGLALDVGPSPSMDETADVWFCIRPEQVTVAPAGEARPAANAFEAQVTRERFESGVHRLTLRLAGGDAPLTAKVFPPTYRALHLGQRRAVAVCLPPDALHLIGPA